MGVETMGQIVVTALIENLEDIYISDRGHRAAGEVRSVAVEGAMIDVGTTQLSLPKGMIQDLGLKPSRKQTARTADGMVRVQGFGPVRITIQGRDCISQVTELSDDCPVLIGQIPLALLDLVVDPVGHRLIGNPAHDGEQMIEIY